MKKTCIPYAKVLVPSLLLCSLLTSVQSSAQTAMSMDASGTITIHEAKVPLPKSLSAESRKVLMRTSPTEGPGAPVPPPSEISDMSELRRVYNQNLQVNVDHIRDVFPVDIEETTINGITATIITPKGGVPDKNINRLILNGPGGGFRTGVQSNGLLISIPMAATLGVKVISIIYRQGPEFQFPAASEDLLKVWNEVTKNYKPENIGLLGCSAGGSLMTQTTALLIESNRPTPGVLGIYCSGLGYMQSGDSQLLSSLSITNIPMGLPEVVETQVDDTRPAMSYFDGVDQQQFAISPTEYPDLLAKFPPTLFFTATRDFAMSGAAYGHRKLLGAGVESDLLIFEGLYHGFMTNPDFPEAQEGYKISADFFDQHLGK